MVLKEHWQKRASATNFEKRIVDIYSGMQLILKITIFSTIQRVLFYIFDNSHSTIPCNILDGAKETSTRTNYKFIAPEPNWNCTLKGFAGNTDVNSNLNLQYTLLPVLFPHTSTNFAGLPLIATFGVVV